MAAAEGSLGGPARPVRCAVYTTCRTAQADAAGWGNRRQRAAARVRGRWAGGGEGPWQGRITAVEAFPLLSRPLCRVSWEGTALNSHCACTGQAHGRAHAGGHVPAHTPGQLPSP